jgi:hypothetical protein
METKITTKPRGTVRAVVTRADGTVEDLGVIAEMTVEDAPPGLMRMLKEAWVEGWDEGSERKDEA